jgi:hypothetical protein
VRPPTSPRRSPLAGPLVIGIDGRDAGGIGGIMANVNVGGRDYTSGSAWRCWQTETQTELSAHDMQLWGDGGFEGNWVKPSFSAGGAAP